MKPKYILKNGTPLFAYCSKKGIRYDTVIKRMKKYDLTPDEAITKKKAEKIDVVVTLKKIAKQEGIDFNKLYKAYTKLLPSNRWKLWVLL